MIGRLVLAAALGVVLVPVGAAPSPATGTGIAVSDVTVAEPNYPRTSTTVPVTITLDQPAAAPVSVVWYAFNPPGSTRRTVADASGTLTFATGETTKSVSVTVLRRTDTYQDTTFTVRAVEQTGTTGWEDQGTGTVVNSDRAGVWQCRGTALWAGATVSPPKLPDAEQQVDVGPGWTSYCDYGAGLGRIVGTSPPPVQVGDYTIAVSAGEVNTDRGTRPPAGDTRPFVGDGATTTSSVTSVSITGPGVDVRIDSAWGRASTRCEALDTLPSLGSASGVTGVVVNGDRVDAGSDPATYPLPGGLVLRLNATTGDATHSGRAAVLVEDAANPRIDYAVIGFAEVGYVDNPCTT